MKLSHQIFFGYLLVIALTGFFLLQSVKQELHPAVHQSIEDTLVDTANLLAEIVTQDLQNNTLSNSNFHHAIQRFAQRTPHASIWGHVKNSTSYRLYITDKQGIVLYDSDHGRAIGEDYSQWNDVYLTLRGEYGARSTKESDHHNSSSIMHVAAPIRHNGAIIGVLTVAKPNRSTLPFIELGQRNIVKAGAILLLVAVIFGWFFSALLARSTRKLSTYALHVQKGQKTSLPVLHEPELAQLGAAIESMRLALEGKDYVEHYIHTLTHEIKSPLSGITGACELLHGHMSDKDRAHFLRNIEEDAKRIRNIIDRLLDLAQMEAQQHLTDLQPLMLAHAIDDVFTVKSSQLTAKSLSYSITPRMQPPLYGDPFLVRQALHNIVDNAIDFAPAHSSITVDMAQCEEYFSLTLHDQGQGIPSYARGKIFDRFYSLQRPDTGKKSTGLGLNFTQQIMELHQGNITITSDEAGCHVTLSFPLSIATKHA